jgi:hypothetical protein
VLFHSHNFIKADPHIKEQKKDTDGPILAKFPLFSPALLQLFVRLA